MPVHDWTRVEAGIWHAFHHRWISAISDALNTGVLPGDYYALPEQYAAGFGPDVLALELVDDAGQSKDEGRFGRGGEGTGGGTGLLVAPPKLAPTAETDMEFYLRKQSSIAVRHVSGDRVVAMVELASPGNKSIAGALRAFVHKASDFLKRGVHLLIVDLFPPGPRDPMGLHAAVWDDVAGQAYAPPAGRALTVAAYESDLAIRAYAQPVAVGDSLPDMPLFLAPNACVEAPLDATYRAAFAVMPARWRRVLEPAGRES